MSPLTFFLATGIVVALLGIVVQNVVNTTPQQNEERFKLSERKEEVPQVEISCDIAIIGGGPGVRK